MKLRPITPHLTIYRMESNMLLSITHRISGGLLTMVFYGICSIGIILSLYWSNYFVYYLSYQVWYHFDLIVMCIVPLFIFHMCTGVRHLVWDMGYGLDMETIDRTSLLIVLLTILLSAVVFEFLFF